MTTKAYTTSGRMLNFIYETMLAGARLGNAKDARIHARVLITTQLEMKAELFSPGEIYAATFECEWTAFDNPHTFYAEEVLRLSKSESDKALDSEIPEFLKGDVQAAKMAT